MFHPNYSNILKKWPFLLFSVIKATTWSKNLSWERERHWLIMKVLWSLIRGDAPRRSVHHIKDSSSPVRSIVRRAQDFLGQKKEAFVKLRRSKISTRLGSLVKTQQNPFANRAVSRWQGEGSIRQDVPAWYGRRGVHLQRDTKPISRLKDVRVSLTCLIQSPSFVNGWFSLSVLPWLMISLCSFHFVS